MMLVQQQTRVLGPRHLQSCLWQSPLLQHLRLYTNVATDGSVSYLRSAKTGAEVYLVGTAHVSSKSAEEVYQVINQVKPDAVAVELCADRAKKLMAGQKDDTTNSFLGTIAEFFKTPGGFGQKMISYAFKSIYAMLRNTGMEPGKEFKVACEEAEKIGAALLFIDQEGKVTMQRVADVITYQDVFRLLINQSEITPEMMQQFESGDIEQAVEKLKTRENVRATMKSMEVLFPKLVQVMIHERDTLMVERLRECKGKVVGVVGMAHMDGIERLWKEMET